MVWGITERYIAEADIAIHGRFHSNDMSQSLLFSTAFIFGILTRSLCCPRRNLIIQSCLTLSCLLLFHNILCIFISVCRLSFTLYSSILFLSLQNISHTLHGNPSLTHIRNNPSQASHRPGQRRIVGNKCHKLAQCDPSIHGKNNTSHHNHQHLQVGDQISRCPVNAHQFSKIYPQIGVGIIFLIKPIDLILFSTKSTHYTNSSQILLHGTGKCPLRLISILKTFPDPGIEIAGITDDHREKSCRSQCDLHIHGKHDSQIQYDQETDSKHLRQLPAHKITDHFHVRGTSLDDLPGLVLYMPGKRQILGVVIQGVTDGFQEIL